MTGSQPGDPYLPSTDKEAVTGSHHGGSRLRLPVIYYFHRKREVTDNLIKIHDEQATGLGGSSPRL